MIELKRTLFILLPLLALAACGGGSSSDGGGQQPGPGDGATPDPDPDPIQATCSTAVDQFAQIGTATVPAGCTRVRIEAVGGGGGGGGSIALLDNDSAQPGKRAGVDYAEHPVTPGEKLKVIVGQGGQGGRSSDGLEGGSGGRGGEGNGNGSPGTRGKNGIVVVLPFGGGGGGGGGGATSVRRESGEWLAHAPGGDGGTGADCGLLCAAEGEGGAGATSRGSASNNSTAFGHGGETIIGGPGMEGSGGVVVITYN